MSHLMSGIIKGKKVEVFSSASEAKDYCRSHGGSDHRWNYKPITVYACYKMWCKKLGRK